MVRGDRPMREHTPSCLQLDNNSDLTHKAYSYLSNRQFKGWSFEVYVQHILRRCFVPFIGNPLDPKQWLQTQGNGVDVITKDLLIESKAIYHYRFSSGNVYHDLLPRFGKIKVRKLKIMLTNDKTRVTRPALRLLEREGIKLWSVEDLKAYYIFRFVQFAKFLIKLREDWKYPSFISIRNMIKHEDNNNDDPRSFTIVNHTTFMYVTTKNYLYSSRINDQKYSRTRLKQSNNQTVLLNFSELSSGDHESNKIELTETKYSCKNCWRYILGKCDLIKEYEELISPLREFKNKWNYKRIKHKATIQTKLFDIPQLTVKDYRKYIKERRMELLRKITKCRNRRIYLQEHLGFSCFKVKENNRENVRHKNNHYEDDLYDPDLGKV